MAIEAFVHKHVNDEELLELWNKHLKYPTLYVEDFTESIDEDGIPQLVNSHWRV